MKLGHPRVSLAWSGRVAGCIVSLLGVAACGGPERGSGAAPPAAGLAASAGPARLEARSVPAGAGAAGLPFALVIGDRVLLSSSAEEGWAGGPPVVEADPPLSGTLVSRAADISKLPAALSRLRGERVQVFTERGPLCLATLGEPRLVGVFFGTPGAEAGEEGETDQDGVEPDEGGPDTAEAAWGWTTTSRYLMADLHYDPAGCPDGDRDLLADPATPPLRWVRSAGLPVPPMAQATEADPHLVDLVLAAQRELPAYKELQQGYEAWHQRARERAGEEGWPDQVPARPGLWDALNGPPEVKVLRLGPSATGQGLTLLLVRSYAADSLHDVCAFDAFGGELWTLWEVGGPAGAPRLVLREATQGNPPIEAAVDVDGRGDIRLLFRGRRGPGALRRSGVDGAYDESDELLGHDFDFVCPC